MSNLVGPFPIFPSVSCKNEALNKKEIIIWDKAIQSAIQVVQKKYKFNFIRYVFKLMDSCKLILVLCQTRIESEQSQATNRNSKFLSMSRKCRPPTICQGTFFINGKIFQNRELHFAASLDEIRPKYEPSFSSVVLLPSSCTYFAWTAYLFRFNYIYLTTDFFRKNSKKPYGSSSFEYLTIIGYLFHCVYC